jgi:hypothetical protein
MKARLAADEFSGLSYEKRRKNRKPAPPTARLTIMVENPPGKVSSVAARLVDYSDDGLGIECPTALAEGSLVTVSGHIEPGLFHKSATRPAIVCWCVATPGGAFCAGLSFGRAAKSGPREPAVARDDGAVDHYEILQLSPNADPDTIHRVFRIMAQRYHPDNRETGNEEQFKALLAAYHVLCDPEKRAAYDIHRGTAEQERWRVFDEFDATQGVEAEKRKRQGILSVLYTKRLRQPEQPYLNLRELEDLLGCPREHLEFSIWYLKESACIVRSDNGRFAITARGVDQAESVGVGLRRELPMITAAADQQSTCQS